MFPPNVPTGRAPMQAPVAASDFDVEFSSEELTGFRVWRLHKDMTLSSVTYAIEWPARKPMRAHCLYAWAKTEHGRSFYTFPHCAPSTEHTCGIYAVKKPYQMNAWASARAHYAIKGRVTLWGRVLRYTEGYMAEYAYPKELWVPERVIFGQDRQDPREVAVALSDRYGVRAVVRSE